MATMLHTWRARWPRAARTARWARTARGPSAGRLSRAAARAVAALLILAVLPAASLAQQRLERFDTTRANAAAEASFHVPGSGLDLVGIGKWATLAASVGAGAYGLMAHFDANDKFERLQRICETDGDRCQNRTSGGAYADPELESLYQDVVALDRAAKIALIASQVSVAGSVVLFIMDLQESDVPPNIPYDPQGFELMPRRDGAALRWSLPVGW